MEGIRSEKTQESLFKDSAAAENISPSANSPAPLAERLRPLALKDFLGQEHVVAAQKPLVQEIENDRLSSYIFWGPPGCGKTTLARIIAASTKRRFIAFSAVLGGVKEIREIVAEARYEWEKHQRQTILFIDEVHHFNKSQQDALLPHVENGTLTLIGATTENPSFEINKALLSRCRIVVLKPLGAAELKTLLLRTWEKIVGTRFEIPNDTLIEMMIAHSEGDARRLLNILEGVFHHLNSGGELTANALEDILLHRPLSYDRAGEDHYNIISAFIKSLRGTDPDAALHYLARMLESGEDPRFICRRMMIFAAEDIGNADPRALTLAVSTADAFERIGLPEGWIPLAQCATYLASAPKSNAAYQGYLEAKADVLNGHRPPVPLHLRNAPTSLLKSLDYGKNYRYPHKDVGNINAQAYLPPQLQDREYYRPSEQGYEAKLKPYLDKIRALRSKKA